MVFQFTDIEEFMKLLREHPDWRDQLRRELLSDELVQLPAVVAELVSSTQRLEQRIDNVAAELRELTGIVKDLAVQTAALVGSVDRLGGRMDHLTGRVDPLQRWRFAAEFNAPSRIADFIRRPRRVYVGDIEEVLDARDDGTITREEYEGLRDADFLFVGRDGKGPDAPTLYAAMEVSVTVDRNDVRRAHERAETLRKCGLQAVGVAGGRRFTEGASAYAQELGVRLVTGGKDRDPAESSRSN